VDETLKKHAKRWSKVDQKWGGVCFLLFFKVRPYKQKKKIDEVQRFS